MNIRDWTIVVSTKSYEHLGILSNVDPSSISFVSNFNSADELSFDVYKYLDGHKEVMWDLLVPLKTLYVPELDEYFEIDLSLDESREKTVITITATSLCEAELGQIEIRDLNINNEDDINWDEENEVFLPTKFYDRNNPKTSLLDRLLEKAPHYAIGHVDDSLKDLQRSFQLNGDIYNCLTGDVAEQFQCLFLFDSTTRTVSAYDLASTCTQCGFRGEFVDDYECPECGSTNRTYYGDDTTIYIDTDNLTEDIKFETDTSSIKNCFKLEAGDEMMTTAVIAQNPNGSEYIYYLSEDTLADMPIELQNKLQQYNNEWNYYQNNHSIALNVFDINNVIRELKTGYELQFKDDKKTLNEIENQIIGYPNLMLVEYEARDLYQYVKSNMMPVAEQALVNASTEAAKLTVSNLSPLALQKVTNSTSSETVESALKNYAKVYAKTGYVSLDVTTTSLSNEASVDIEGANYKIWRGYIKVTNWSDDKDIRYSCASGVVTTEEEAQSNPMQIKVYDKFDEFIEQKIIKSIKTNEDDNNSVFNILKFSITNKDYSFNPTKEQQLKQALQLYSSTRVHSFADAFQTGLDIIVELGQARNEVYDIYYRKMELCTEIAEYKDFMLRIIEDFLRHVSEKRMEIQQMLNFQSYLGADLFRVYSMYRREGEYSNSNFISDNLSDAEVFDKAKEFLIEANRQLKIAATPQHTISGDLFNIFGVKDFEQIRNKFKNGNFLRVRVNDKIYRLRLIKWSPNASDDTKIDVEFSDLTVAPGISNDLSSILNSAKGMSSTYSYVSKQASSGKKANTRIDDIVRNGLNSALIQINNNINEEVTINNHGILARAYDADLDEYSPEQLRITGNMLIFSSNNWKSAETALGKNVFYTYDKDNDVWFTEEGYGLTAKYVQSGQIASSTIVGGEIYSDNYSFTEGMGTYMNLETGEFSLAGGIMTYDPDSRTFKMDFSKSGLSSSKEIQDLNDRIDNINVASGNNTYAGDVPPTLDNYPANEWTNKEGHVGDLYVYNYIDSKGKEVGDIYRFSTTDIGYEWKLISTSDGNVDTIAEIQEEYCQKPIEAGIPSIDDAGWSTTFPNFVDDMYTWIRVRMSITSGENSETDVEFKYIYSDPIIATGYNSIYHQITNRLDNDKKELDDKITELDSSINSISQDIDNNLRPLAMSVEQSVNELKYAYIDEDGNLKKSISFKDGAISLQNAAGSSSVTITNDAINLKTQNAEENVTTITSTEMIVTRGRYRDQLQIGSFAFIPRIKEDGSFGNLRFIKVTQAALDRIGNDDIDTEM